MAIGFPLKKEQPSCSHLWFYKLFLVKPKLKSWD
jgi:hypothetical protein